MREKGCCDICLQYVDADELVEDRSPPKGGGFYSRIISCSVCRDLRLSSCAHFGGRPLELGDIARAVSIAVREMRESVRWIKEALSEE